VTTVNGTLARTRINTLICPSESRTVGPWQTNTWTNYHVNISGPPSQKTWSGVILPMRSDPNGALCNNTPCPGQTNGSDNPGGQTNWGVIGLQSIADGTSNTALMSEKLVAIGGSTPIQLNSSDGIRAIFVVTSNTITPNQGNTALTDAFVRACNALPGTTMSYTPSQWSGAVWHGSHAGTMHFNAYTHVNTPNKMSCHSNGAPGGPPGSWWDAITATSRHPGGVNVVFCDGSVRFIKDTVALPIWWGIGTREGGEVISSDAL
jgi:prepilin-type processing-associated H-X9-DG protein